MKKQSSGIPRYLATFADLMTLLLCFFVLLLSMAEIDALKYKVVVRSMENAFGVKKDTPEEIVKATSIIKQTFSPSPTDTPSPLSKIFQESLNDERVIKIHDANLYQRAKLNSLMATLQKKFIKAITAGQLSLETIDDRVIIRINENASFPSGQATLKSGILPVIAHISDVLTELNTTFVVAGHTDNVPLSNLNYRSNWELSAARATSVVHALLGNKGLQPEQFRVEAYADTRPIRSNLTSQGRAMNRRVEIGIINP
ncbi:MAG TPA: cell envelope biogenesis protein OmpA [Methylophaga aminisulfidivorans]|jgi:chemotaxis protein MotB|uniref:Flagellar motor protein n=1 Tax=Methylophaga aminisulfidivorans MP TaxID=1026882 RepID=F5SZK9_9GAMM|nr:MULTISPECIES: flagellar motor protein MotB [Methylophaga]EGL54436.1 flagellar motor protein [Methylophaga aminisulfidivorans MP]WVI85623.1 flagellar motor protein MotB [Methylophaga thalassica]HIC46379.1 cell envelope biogenesis protein OmpA [Methylophaga sp.]HIM38823.1 cell envelope biogenesis protein OmpA [Methylophaga aminisulfidivorans]